MTDSPTPRSRPNAALRNLPRIFLAALTLAGSPFALSVTSYYPAPGATGQCLDTPLRMNLSGKAVLNWGGSIRLRNVATNTVVKTWNLTSNPGDPLTTAVSTTWPYQDSVGNTWRNVWPVVLDSVPSYLAEIRVPQHLLAANTKYQVEVDAGVLKGSDGSSFSGVSAGTWTFTTKAKPLSKASIVVAGDNSGDVCSIQEGLTLAPASSSSAVQVLVKAGYYREPVSIKNRNNLQLYGAGTDKTILRYLNSNNLNASSSGRNLMMLEGTGMSLRAFSIVNTVTVTGSQAEAIYLIGDKNIVADVFLHSFQDTWLNKSGRAYAQDVTLEGSVDFIWGYSPTMFKRCNLVINRTGGVVVQPRNEATTHGYVFDGCTLNSDKSGYSGNHFARDAGTSYAGGEVMFLNTKILSNNGLAASPWTITSGIDQTNLRLCEYKSVDANGTLITISDSQRKAHQCAADSATAHADPSTFFAGWTPSVPSLSSVLSWVGTTSVDRLPHTATGFARLSRNPDGIDRLILTAGGPSVVREILPDGTSKELLRCEGPCEEPLGSTSRGGISWIEVLNPSGRTVLARNNLPRSR